MAEQQNASTLIKEMNGAVKSLRDMVEKKASKEEIDRVQTALDEMEIKMQRINTSAPATEGKESKEDVEYKSAFEDYIRNGSVTEMLDKKSMSTDSNPDGGYLVTPMLSQKIIEKIREYSPIRELANVVTLSNTNSYRVPRETSDFGGGWVGEREERPETETGKIEMVNIQLFEQYAQPGITRGLLTDSSFDWEGYIIRKIVDKFARMEGEAFVKGDGVNKPTGFLNDPSLQEVEGKLDFDGLIDLYAELPEEFLPRANWIFNRFTLRELRKIKNTNGDYIWQPSTQLGMPSTILEIPYKLAADMPNPSIGSKVVALGDFMSGYTVVDGNGMYMLRDEYTKKPNILFYTTKRVGGGVENNQAIKILKQNK